MARENVFMGLEKNLQNEIFKKYGSLPWLKIWRTNTGNAVGLSFIMAAKKLGYIPDNLPVTKYGVSGYPDITGIIKGGKFLAIEVKSLTGKQTTEQKLWEKIITQMGGVYILARKIEDLETINRLAEILGV
jgi:hypothetical protein